MAKKRDLRMISSKIPPAYSEEDLDHRPAEDQDGEVGKGPLVRKYIANLDMEFIAFRSKEKRDQNTSPVTVRIPEDLLSDIAYLVQSGKLPFRDKSQFIRSAVFILMNYYGRKFPYMARKMKLQDGIELCNFEAYMKRMVAKYLAEFEKTIPELEEKSDSEKDRFLAEHLKVIEAIWDPKIKQRVKEKFCQILVENKIDPIPYFGEGREEEEDEKDR